ncbi:MAG: ABC transporter permease subunit [Deltaproteobacteria bacterium]|jgi:His/Glu/Gln/Arg/opine family amino acid ABC transporter permease subunit|nr:ABC transporter permease subunit [Deltaproteobacteria bacterium]
MSFFLGWGREITLGVFLTIVTALMSLSFGIVIGLAVALLKRSTRNWLKVFGDAYTTVIRGTPELLIILFVYFGSTIAISKLASLWVGKETWITPPVLVSGVIALSVVFGGYAAESIRGGMLAVPVGQVEAAAAFGLSSFQSLFYVKIPLIWRHSLPALGNNWLALIKSTSLISLISMEELMRKCTLAANDTSHYFRFYLIAAGLYLSLTGLNVYIIHRLEKKARQCG